MSTELDKYDQAIGAYKIAHVTEENPSRFLLNYPNGSVAVFASKREAQQYADEYNNTPLYRGQTLNNIQRAIDSMTDMEIEILKLKGML